MQVDGKRIKCTLKDQNWIENKRAIGVGTHRRSLLHQLNLDTRFLEKFRIMDYSLLVGVHSQYEDAIDEDILSDLVDRTWDSDSSSSAAHDKFFTAGLVKDGYPSKSTYAASLRRAPSSSRRQRSGTAGADAQVQPSADADGAVDRRATTDATSGSVALTDDGIAVEQSSSASGAGEYDVYYLGLIDIFQTYNNKKRMENVAKNVKLRVVQAPMRLMNPQKKLDTNISACDPHTYQQRFMTFVSDHVLPKYVLLASSTRPPIRSCVHPNLCPS